MNEGVSYLWIILETEDVNFCKSYVKGFSDSYLDLKALLFKEVAIGPATKLLLIILGHSLSNFLNYISLFVSELDFYFT